MHRLRQLDEDVERLRVAVEALRRQLVPGPGPGPAAPEAAAPVAPAAPPAPGAGTVPRGGGADDADHLRAYT